MLKQSIGDVPPKELESQKLPRYSIGLTARTRLGYKRGMPLLIDELFYFVGWHSAESRCRVRVFTPPVEAREDGYLVILTDDQQAAGTSVTNAAERLAVLVCAKYHIPQTRAQFIEHWDFRHLPGGHDELGRTETFARVNFQVSEIAQDCKEYVHGSILGRPDWKHIDKHSVEILIGEPLT